MKHRSFWAAAVAAMAVCSLFIGATVAHADGPYFPPTPGPVRVEPGLMQMGEFPVPGLYLGITSPGQPPKPQTEIKITVDGLPPTADPVAGPPKGDGSLDSVLLVGVKDKDPSNPFIGVVTFHYGLCVKNPDTLETVVCHTFDLVLYVGVDIPDTGADTERLVATGAAAVLLGGGLLVISRRRRLIPVRAR